MTLKGQIREVVESSTSPAGRVFDRTIQTLIFVSIASFSLETLPALPDGLRRLLAAVEVGCVMVFSIEYLVRVLAAPSPRKYIFSPMGIVDLIAVLPFYIATTVDLRSLRIIRLLRLLRAVKALRYSETLDRMLKAFFAIHRELAVFGVACIIVLYIAAVGIYYFEREAQPEAFASIFHAMWWAVATLTTVGYGDVYPVTIAGRAFTGVMLFVGLGIVAVPSGLFASALNATSSRTE